MGEGQKVAAYFDLDGTLLNASSEKTLTGVLARRRPGESLMQRCMDARCNIWPLDRKHLTTLCEIADISLLHHGDS